MIDERRLVRWATDAVSIPSFTGNPARLASSTALQYSSRSYTQRSDMYGTSQISAVWRK